VTKEGRHSEHKNKIRRLLNKKWESKLMHGQCIGSKDRQLIDEVDKFLWL
jgi:hypothetical protein